MVAYASFALLLVSLVVINSFSVNALPVPFAARSMCAPGPEVTRVVTPSISSAPVCVMFPAVAVPLKVPPIVDAAKFNPTAFTMVTAPVPLGARVKAPVTASWFRVIIL